MANAEPLGAPVGMGGEKAQAEAVGEAVGAAGVGVASPNYDGAADASGVAEAVPPRLRLLRGVALSQPPLSEGGP